MPISLKDGKLDAAEFVTFFKKNKKLTLPVLQNMVKAVTKYKQKYKYGKPKTYI